MRVLSWPESQCVCVCVFPSIFLLLFKGHTGVRSEHCWFTLLVFCSFLILKPQPSPGLQRFGDRQMCCQQFVGNTPHRELYFISPSSHWADKETESYSHRNSNFQETRHQRTVTMFFEFGVFFRVFFLSYHGWGFIFSVALAREGHTAVTAISHWSGFGDWPPDSDQ